MNCMFQLCKNLTQLDLSSFSTNNVKNMHFMLSNLNNAQQINLSSATFENVENYEDILTHTNKVEVIIVKDENAKNFIQSRLNETGNNATVKINGVP